MHFLFPCRDNILSISNAGENRVDRSRFGPVDRVPVPDRHRVLSQWNELFGAGFMNRCRRWKETLRNHHPLGLVLWDRGQGVVLCLAGWVTERVGGVCFSSSGECWDRFSGKVLFSRELFIHFAGRSLAPPSSSHVRRHPGSMPPRWVTQTIRHSVAVTPALCHSSRSPSQYITHSIVTQITTCSAFDHTTFIRSNNFHLIN